MKYRDKIVFVTQSTTSDGAGGKTVTGLTTMLTCWAKMESKGLSRSLQDSRITHNCAYEITLPYQFGYTPTPKDFIQFNGQTLTIHGVPDVRIREKEIKILAYG
jgi:SPP1 family predicted phage head-tail adaptor